VFARAAGAARRWLVYGAWLLAVLLAVDYGLYRLRIRPEIPERDPLAGWEALEPALRSRLGFLRAPELRRSSFGNFPTEKPPGTTRIGCFGDSFTWGSEVEDGLDWPLQLQELLRWRGRGDVEVLNFGNGSYGFHQTYLLWEALGRRYDLDLVLLAAQDFWPRRDTSFLNPFEHARVLHARFVLHDGGLALLDPVGIDPAERARAFDRFVPPWRYLRYERTAPAFLRALLPRGRALENPFYYDARDADAEAFAGYALLLARMAQADTPLLLLDDRRSRFSALAAQLAVPALPLVLVDDFPYQAPRGHRSPWGNRDVAEQVLAHLEGAPGRPPGRIELRDLAPGEAEPDAAARALARPGSEMAVHLGATAVGGVYRRRPDAPGARRVPAFGSDRDAVLAVRTGAGTLADALFFALRGSPPELALHLPDGRIVRASAQRVSERASLWVHDLAAAAREQAGLPLGAATRASVATAHEPRAGASDLRLYAQGRLVARAVFDPARGAFRVVPESPYHRLAADGWTRPDEAALPDEGWVHWVIAREGAAPELVRLAAWRRRLGAAPAPPFDAPVEAD
jgi:hypothetical protein